MRKTLAAMMILTIVLGGCGAVRDSRLNPFNWFGRAQSTENTASSTNPLIPTRSGGINIRRPTVYTGAPVDRLTGLVIERIPGGAIVRVTAVAAQQGSYNVRISPDEGADTPVKGVLSYTLMAETPRRPQPVGTEASRRITAALYLSDPELIDVRTIKVAAARNTMTTRR